MVGECGRWRLRFEQRGCGVAAARVTLSGFGARALRRLQRVALSNEQWRSVFSVYAENSRTVLASSIPPMLGDYQVTSDGVSFLPRYPLVTGLAYCAVVVPDRLALLLNLWRSRGGESFRKFTLQFSLRDSSVVAPSTKVTAVYPSVDRVPEDLLRFYLYFSAPMERGWARESISLQTVNGTKVDAAFFNLAYELWDNKQRRLTLLLDPGRIKRGVGPNVRMGPPFEMGHRYTLVIEKGMRACDGRPLAQSFSKTFLVDPPVRTPVNPSLWLVHLPEIGGRLPLMLKFDRPLDWAMLAHSLRITDASRRQVPGDINIDEGETRWSFAPDSAWSDGAYELSVDSRLEDPSGNNLRAPFDVDVRHLVGAGRANVGLPPVPNFRPAIAASGATLRANSVNIDFVTFGGGAEAITADDENSEREREKTVSSFAEIVFAVKGNRHSASRSTIEDGER
jgi:hypothetical protein